MIWHGAKQNRRLGLKNAIFIYHQRPAAGVKAKTPAFRLGTTSNQLMGFSPEIINVQNPFQSFL